MNNLKTQKTYLILLLMLSFSSLEAQVALNGQPVISHVKCQHSAMGSIEVRIKPIHPPYAFNWSTGEKNTEKIVGLEVGNYWVKIVDAIGADTTLQFVIEEQQCELTPEIFFTPNGDGVNDHWYISYSQYFPNALVLVYNRLGQLVYENNGEYNASNRWDGSDLLGIPLPVSTYFFIVYSDKSNKKKVRKGSVSIIR